jgi:TolB-like protein
MIFSSNLVSMQVATIARVQWITVIARSSTAMRDSR